MGHRSGRSDINEISIRMSIWDMVYRYATWYIDMVVYHIDDVILDIDMGYDIEIWEMPVSIWSSPISISDILSLWGLAVIARHVFQRTGARAKACVPPLTRAIASRPLLCLPRHATHFEPSSFESNGIL